MGYIQTVSSILDSGVKGSSSLTSLLLLTVFWFSDSTAMLYIFLASTFKFMLTALLNLLTSCPSLPWPRCTGLSIPAHPFSNQISLARMNQHRLSHIHFSGKLLKSLLCLDFPLSTASTLSFGHSKRLAGYSLVLVLQLSVMLWVISTYLSIYQSFCQSSYLVFYVLAHLHDRFYLPLRCCSGTGR